MDARRADAVAPDVLFHVVDRDRHRHRVHGALGHRVREPVRHADQRRDGRHVQDHAATLPEHNRHGGAGAQVDTPLTLTRVQPIQIGFRRALDRADMGDPGVVDQDVERGACSATMRSNTPAHVSAVRHIARDRRALPAGAADLAVAVSRAAASSRSSTTTRACWRANRRAIAAPMPDPAPVTTATFFPRSKTPVEHACPDPREILYFTGKVNGF